MNRILTENEVTITGFAAIAPVIKKLDNGMQVARLPIAHHSMASNGQRRTHWYTIVLWNELAAIAVQKISKGDFIGFRGKLNTREFEGKHNITYRITEILASQFWTNQEKVQDPNQLQLRLAS
ncbi:MAG: single-stranded DNA-binding protein [Bacteroidia bacterium]|nr:single-stranded DNA-binding protein [Bacteroidia bacterium]